MSKMHIRGKPVVDATLPLEIHITPEDVKSGRTKDPSRCAAARAICREMHAPAARVHVGRTYIEKPDVWIRYDTPRSLRTEVITFDRGGKFEPGPHVLKVPWNTSEQRHRYYVRQKKAGKLKHNKKRDGGSGLGLEGMLDNKKHMLTGVRHHAIKR